MASARDTIFVYGTLRFGASNASMWPGSATFSHVGRSYVRGRLHYVEGNGPGGYPVYVPSDDDVWVVGDLVHVNMDSPIVTDIVNMELRAGYNCQWTHVYDHPDSPKERFEALAFVWPWSTYGAHIPSGDWTTRFDPYPQAWTLDSTDTPTPTSDDYQPLHCDGCDRYVEEASEFMGYLLCPLCHPDPCEKVTL